VGGGQWAVGSERHETAIHPSSFIPHPSSFDSHPYKPGNKLPGHHAGYTLVEILVATAITLLLMGAVVQMFGALGQSITDSRSFLEASERLNAAAYRLQMDLKGVTVKMIPPRNPDDGEGYFEYIEGPLMLKHITQNPADYDWINNPERILPKPVNSENTQPATATTDPSVDTTVGDFDDILMFTTRSTDSPYIGLFNYGTTANPIYVGNTPSDVAEVAWFIRGRTLHRRLLLVSPAMIPNPLPPADATGFYAYNEISMRIENGQYLANSLGDLTRRECRFAHPHSRFPFDARLWGQFGLPTVNECSTIGVGGWTAGNWTAFLPSEPQPNNVIDFWAPGTSPTVAENALAPGGARVADDVILTNVIGFDVKAWDPGAPVLQDASGNRITPGNSRYILPGDPRYSADSTISVSFGAYVDLGYAPLYNPGLWNRSPPLYPPSPLFNGFGNPRSLLTGSTSHARVYDTWSTNYENVGLPGLTYPGQYPAGGFPGRSTNGFDDAGALDDLTLEAAANGMVDDKNERITSPPYPVPLRGIQVKIRVFEPDSRQIRELTIVQDFLPK
jgi:hypothetical protein